MTREGSVVGAGQSPALLPKKPLAGANPAKHRPDGVDVWHGLGRLVALPGPAVGGVGNLAAASAFPRRSRRRAGRPGQRDGRADSGSFLHHQPQRVVGGWCGLLGPAVGGQAAIAAWVRSTDCQQRRGDDRHRASHFDSQPRSAQCRQRGASKQRRRAYRVDRIDQSHASTQPARQQQSSVDRSVEPAQRRYPAGHAGDSVHRQPDQPAGPERSD